MDSLITFNTKTDYIKFHDVIFRLSINICTSFVCRFFKSVSFIKIYVSKRFLLFKFQTFFTENNNKKVYGIHINNENDYEAQRYIIGPKTRSGKGALTPLGISTCV